MIYIRKNSEPAKLLWYRHQSNARFDDMDADVKEQLRDSLLREQGHLCAYCMREIHDAGDVKIEHFRARTPENELSIGIFWLCVRAERMVRSLPDPVIRKKETGNCL